jgi:hypothetical protein
MAEIDRRIRILRRLRPDERVIALASVLAYAAPEEREPLTLLLIELATTPGQPRVTEAAAQALAQGWRYTPINLRQLALVACRPLWPRVFTQPEHSEILRSGQSISEWALDACHPAAIPVLGRILEGAESPAPAAASQALLAFAVRVSGEDDPGLLGLDPSSPALRPVLDGGVEPWADSDLAALAQVVARAVETFDAHRRKELLLATILLLEHPRSSGPTALPLRRLIADEESAAGAALRAAFRRARAPIARRRAWQWLRESSVAAACAERVARAPSMADHAAVLSLGHLALAPARATHLRLVSITTRPVPQSQAPPGVAPGGKRLHPEGPAPDRATLASLSPAARRQAPRLVAAMRGDESAKSLALDPFLADPDPLARLNAARVAPAGPQRDFCFDTYETIARHAALAWSACGTAESERVRAGDAHRRRFAASLARSPHPAVRSIALEEHARVSPGSGEPSASLAARRAFAADASAFIDWVRDAVRGGDAEAAVAALMTCRRIRAVGAIEPIVLSVLRGSFADRDRPPARLVATAVACLGDLRAVRIAGLLSECLARHPDARVRANAAEAIGRCRSPDPWRRMLEESIGDEHHRVRASTLRTLLTPWPDLKPGGEAPAAAVHGLASMLLDQRPPHRLAGVWVVQRSLSPAARSLIGRRWSELTARVRSLATADPDAAVRARAAAVTRRLAVSTGEPLRPAGGGAWP